jgi:hypothetical protein
MLEPNELRSLFGNTEELYALSSKLIQTLKSLAASRDRYALPSSPSILCVAVICPHVL